MLAGVLGPVLTADRGAGAWARRRRRRVDIPSFGVLIKALQTNSDVDVLSNPHLLIMNNEDGEISVGQQHPVPGQHARARRRGARRRPARRRSAGSASAACSRRCSARRSRWR